MRINDVNTISDKHTPLQVAVGAFLLDDLSNEQKIARTELARVLIADGGADVNLAVFYPRFQPLHQAIQTQNIYMVELLLANGADPTLTTHVIVDDGETQTMDAYQIAKKEYDDSKGYSVALRRILELLEPESLQESTTSPATQRSGKARTRK